MERLQSEYNIVSTYCVLFVLIVVLLLCMKIILMLCVVDVPMFWMCEQIYV